MDVEQHGSAGVGHVRAVDPARLPPGQTLMGRTGDNRHLSRRLRGLVWGGSRCTYPNEPGVDGAEHGAVRDDGFLDLVHVVHEPAEFHGAEVGADGETRFVLENICGDMSYTTALHLCVLPLEGALLNTRLLRCKDPNRLLIDEHLTFKWFLFLPGVLLISPSTVD